MKNNESQEKPTETLNTSKKKVFSYKNGKKPSILLYIIIIAITLTAIVVTISLGKKNHRETIHLATEQFNRQQLILARSAAKGIETFIADVDDDLFALSNFPVLQRMETGILDRMEILYQGIPPQTSSRRLDKNGILRFIYPNKGWRKDLTGRDYSQTPWFQKSKKTGKVVISDLIINEAGERRIRVVRPVYVNDEKGTIEFNGVIICSVNPETIANLYVSPIVSGDTGYAWLLNEEGVFLAHHEDRFVSRNAFKVRVKTNPELSYNTINNIQQRMMAGEEGTGRYVSGWHRDEKGETEKIIAYTPVYVSGKLWSVAVCAPVDEVERITDKAYRNLLYAVSITILILTTAGVFSFIIVYCRTRILEKETKIRKHAKKRIIHLNSVLQAIRNISKLITKAKDRKRLLQGACDNLIKIRKYNNARIALIEEDGRFITAALAGFGNVFSAMVDDLKRGELAHCIHQAVDKSDVVVVADPAIECSDCPLVGIYEGKARLIARLEHEGHIYGFLTVVVSGEMTVDEDERSLFEEIAGDIAFALHNMELEKKRKKADKRIRTLMESLPVGVSISTQKGGVPEVNKSIWKIFGYNSKEEFVKIPSEAHYYDQKDRDQFIELHKKGLVKNFEVRFKRKDGSVFWGSVTSTIQTIEAGITEFINVFEDITERRQAEEKIRKLSSAIEQSIDGLAMADLEPRLTYVNNAFAMMHGYSPEEMIGMKGVNFVKKEDLNKFISRFNRIKTLGSWMGEMERIKKDGTSFPAFLSVNLLKNAEGRPTGVLAVVKNISEQKKLEAQFRQAQKMEAIGVLAGEVAHDFNNILTIIIGNADITLMNIGKADHLREGIEEIKIAGERAASLTRQLLAFSRKQIITPRILDLNDLLTGVETMLGRMLEENIELLTIQAPALWPVEVDPGQMEQVIMNLAVNASDAMPMGGKLTINTANMELDENYFYKHSIEKEKPNHYVMLGVSDTGSGMDKETLEHIFDPFFTTKGIGKGTGLGLSTVYGIVKQNNGFIWVYSEPGQGTTFKVYLPTAKRDVEPEEKEQLH